MRFCRFRTHKAVSLSAGRARIPVTPHPPTVRTTFEMSGWASAYVELHTLTGGHSDTINSLSFSPDGIYLASCADDQSLLVWNVEEGRLLYRVLFKSKVDRILWHPTSPATIIVGCDNGYIYQLAEFSPVSTPGGCVTPA